MYKNNLEEIRYKNTLRGCLAARRYLHTSNYNIYKRLHSKNGFANGFNHVMYQFLTQLVLRGPYASTVK